MTQGFDATGCFDLGGAMGKLMMACLRSLDTDTMVGEQKANSQGGHTGIEDKNVQVV